MGKRFALLLLLSSSCATTTSSPAERHTSGVVQMAIGGGFTAAGALTLGQAGVVAAVDDDATAVGLLTALAAAELGTGALLLYLGASSATAALDELGGADAK